MQVLELSRKPAMMQSLQLGCIGNAPSTNAYAIMFLAGDAKEYRSLARNWPRIYRHAVALFHNDTVRTQLCGCWNSLSLRFRLATSLLCIGG